MKVNVKANIDPRLIARRTPKADHAVATMAAADTEKFTPMWNGVLKNDTKVIDNKIIYPPPYSQYLYYGKLMVDPSTGSSWASKDAIKILTDKDLVFTKAFHSDAQSHWFEASKALNLDKWLKKYEEVLTGVD